MSDPWIWIEAIMTLAILSYLYKDNPVYKAAEYLFVGVASGYYLSIYFQNVLVPNLFVPVWRGVSTTFGPGTPAPTDLIRLSSLVLAVFMFMRFSPKGAWLSRWPLGALVGAFAGLAVIGLAQGDLIPQIDSNLLPIVTPGAWTTLLGAHSVAEGMAGFLGLFSNIILIVGLLATLVYFFFSLEHRGFAGKTAKLGIYFLMISFGASYGFTVMALDPSPSFRVVKLYAPVLGIFPTPDAQHGC
jgi:hypothetical protein